MHCAGIEVSRQGYHSARGHLHSTADPNDRFEMRTPYAVVANRPLRAATERPQVAVIPLNNSMSSDVVLPRFAETIG